MKFLKGFTLAELMISLAVVGILTGTALYAFRQYDKGVKYIYSNTYHNLDRAWYNAVTYWIPQERRDRDPFASEDTAYERFVDALTHYLNTVGEVNNNDSGINISNEDTFKDHAPNFIAGNGVRYWITGPYCESWNNNPAFMLIFADVNGDKGPNSMRYERGSEENNWRTVDPDIFAFAALDTGRVIPIGPPEFDERYLTTRIVYPDLRANAQRHLRYSPDSLPYAISKAEAWGYYISEPQDEDPEVGGGDGLDVMEDTPYSYNEYVRANLPNNNIIYEFMDGASATNYFARIYADRGNIHLMSNSPNDANNPGYGCRSRSDAECDIIIDKYIH